MIHGKKPLTDLEVTREISMKIICCQKIFIYPMFLNYIDSPIILITLIRCSVYISEWIFVIQINKINLVRSLNLPRPLINIRLIFLLIKKKTFKKYIEAFCNFHSNVYSNFLNFFLSENFEVSV